MTPLQNFAQVILILGLIFFVISKIKKEEGYGGFTILTLTCLFFSLFCFLLNNFLAV